MRTLAWSLWAILLILAVWTVLLPIVVGSVFLLAMLDTERLHVLFMIGAIVFFISPLFILPLGIWAGVTLAAAQKHQRHGYLAVNCGLMLTACVVVMGLSVRG
jgi:hypothetical protein